MNTRRKCMWQYCQTMLSPPNDLLFIQAYLAAMIILDIRDLTENVILWGKKVYFVGQLIYDILILKNINTVLCPW